MADNRGQINEYSQYAHTPFPVDGKYTIWSHLETLPAKQYMYV